MALAPIADSLLSSYLKDDDIADLDNLPADRVEILRILDRHGFECAWLNENDAIITWPPNQYQTLLKILPAMIPDGSHDTASANQHLDVQQRIKSASRSPSDIKDENERKLAVQLLDEPLLRGWRFVAYEWLVVDGRTDQGVGDVLLQHPCGLYLVVEVKWLDHQATGPTANASRTGKRKEVKEQAVRYAAEVPRRLGQPSCPVMAASYTNDGHHDHTPVLRFWRRGRAHETQDIAPHDEADRLMRGLCEVFDGMYPGQMYRGYDGAASAAAAVEVPAVGDRMTAGRTDPPDIKPNQTLPFAPQAAPLCAQGSQGSAVAQGAAPAAAPAGSNLSDYALPVITGLTIGLGVMYAVATTAETVRERPSNRKRTDAAQQGEAAPAAQRPNGEGCCIQ